MARKPVYGERWSESSLERAARQGEELYLRALSRQVNWSPVKQDFCSHQEECANVSLDEAFTSVMNHLHQASKECKKYHCHRVHVKGHEDSIQHCQRFHTTVQPCRLSPKRNLFQREDTVHVTLPQGAYAVTAHKSGSHEKKTKIVQVAVKESILLTYNL